MIRWPAVRRLVVRTVLALFIFTTSAWLVGRAVYAIEYFLAWLGAADLWRVLHAHPLARSIGVGFAAGLIPLQLWLSVSGFIRADVPESLRKLELEKMKSWMFVLYSPILMASLFLWAHDWIAMHARSVTVLQDSSAAPVWRLFEGFFSTNCRNVDDIRLDLWTDNFALQCSTHVTMISIFLMAAGYSIAPWIRSRVPEKSWAESPAGDEVDQEKSQLSNSVSQNDQTP
jgi:hypothetical protein